MDILVYGVGVDEFDLMLELDKDREYFGLTEYNGIYELSLNDEVRSVLDSDIGIDYFGEAFDVLDGVVYVYVSEDVNGQLTLRFVLKFSDVVIDVTQEDIFAESFVSYLGLSYDDVKVVKSNMRVV